MTTPLKINRLYSTHDAQMLETCHTIHGLFSEHLSDFTPFDPALNAGFADDFLEEIQAAQDFKTDAQMIDVMATATQAVEAKMAECRLFFQKTIKYFVELAHPNAPTVHNEYGYNDYMQARSNQSKMIQFFISLHKTAEKYKEKLIDEGFSQERIDDILVRGKELQTLNSTQEMYKRNRTTKTHRRIVLLNTAYLTMQRIRRAAQAVYAHDYGMYQLFLLPWTSGGSGTPSPTPPEEITGTVEQGQTITVAIPDLQPESVLTLTNTGVVPLRFCGSATPAVDCGADGLVLQPGDSAAVTLQSIAPLFGIVPIALNVSHTVAPAGSPNGEFTVSLP